MSNQSLDYKALFDDRASLRVVFWANLITGVVLFTLVLVVGWFVFESFWGSLAIGGAILLAIFTRMKKISIETNIHHKFTQRYEEEAKVLGLDGELSEYLVEEALRILGNGTDKPEAG